MSFRDRRGLIALIAAVAGACGQSRPPASALANQPPVAPRTSPSWHLACVGTPGPIPVKLKTYIFTPVPLAPIDAGPRIADQPRVGFVRTWVQLEDLLSLGHGSLAGCWKWASARGMLPTQVQIEATVDPLGRASRLAVIGGRVRANDELARCLEDTFAGIDLPLPSPRTTHMRATLQFELAAQPPWPAPPTRPTAIASSPPREPSCAQVSNAAGVDVVASPIAFAIDDADESRIPVAPGTVPVISLGCDRVPRPSSSKADFRRAYNSNLGAFQRCWAAEHEREPQLTGTLATKTVFAPAGITRVSVDGPGSRGFHDCIAAALRELWVSPSPRDDVQIEWSFALEPAPESAKTATTTTSPCAERVADLVARTTDRPWLDDPAVLASARELIAYALRVPQADGRACLADAEDLLYAIAVPRGSYDDARTAWLDRIAAVIPASPLLATVGAKLRLAHAEQLVATHDRLADGIAELQTLASDPTYGPRATAELAELTSPKRLHVKCRMP